MKARGGERVELVPPGVPRLREAMAQEDQRAAALLGEFSRMPLLSIIRCRMPPGAPVTLANAGVPSKGSAREAVRSSRRFMGNPLLFI
jgi:hypothetical protein